MSMLERGFNKEYFMYVQLTGTEKVDLIPGGSEILVVDNKNLPDYLRRAVEV